MINTNEELEIIEKLKEENALQKQQIAELSAKLDWFIEQFRLSQHRQFGRSSEQTTPEQVSLFNEAEVEAKPDAPEPTVEEITYKRRKRQGQREEMFKDLPVETIEYRLSEEERVCDICEGELHEIASKSFSSNGRKIKRFVSRVFIIFSSILFILSHILLLCINMHNL